MEYRNYFFLPDGAPLEGHIGNLETAIKARQERGLEQCRIYVEVELDHYTCLACGGWLRGGGVHNGCASYDEPRIPHA